MTQSKIDCLLEIVDFDEVPTSNVEFEYIFDLNFIFDTLVDRFTILKYDIIYDKCIMKDLKSILLCMWTICSATISRKISWPGFVENMCSL